MPTKQDKSQDASAQLEHLDPSPFAADTMIAPAAQIPVDRYLNVLSTPEKAVVLLIVLSLLSGRYTVARVLPGAAGLGWLGSIAIWLVALLVLACLVVALECPRSASPENTYAAISFCLATVSLHLWILLSALWRDYALYAVGDSVPYLGLSIIVLISASWFFTRNRWDLKFDYLCATLLLCGCAYAVAGLASGDLERMSAFGGGPNVFVRVMGVGLGCGFHLATRQRRWRWLAPLPLFAVGAALSGSRGGIVGIAAMLAVFAVYYWHVRNPPLRIIALAMLSIPGLAALGALWPPLREIVQQRFVRLTLQERYLSGRDRLFTMAWDMFQRYPITGVGVDGFRFWRMRTEGLSLYPHNIVLQLAAETGAVGLGMFALLLWSLATRWARAKGLTCYSALAIGVMFLVTSMFSGDFYDARMTWLFLTLYMLPPEHGDLTRDAALAKECATEQ